MKRTLVPVILLQISVTLVSHAEDSRLRSEAHLSASWSDYYDFPSSGVGTFDVLQNVMTTVAGIRGGATADLMYRASDTLEIGLESGALAMYSQQTDSSSQTVYTGIYADLPLTLKSALILGPFAFESIMGMLFNFSMYMDNSISFRPNYYVGLRAFIADLFVEADYVMALTEMPLRKTRYLRFVAGFKVPLLK